MFNTSHEDIFSYHNARGHNSTCGLHILQQMDGKVIVILRELAENPGASITNCYEAIATQIYNQYLAGTPIDNIVWIEHYNEESYADKSDETEMFDHVVLKWDAKTKRFYMPQWRHIGANVNIMFPYGKKNAVWL